MEASAGAAASVFTWQQSLQRAVRSTDALLQALGLQQSDVPDADAASAFPLLVPWEFLQRMRRGDPADPLLQQVLPIRQESATVPGFGLDPVGDAGSMVAPGLLHKYQGRVLLIASGACAVHCRYCFRRHYPYDDSPKSQADWEPALVQLREDTSVQEVILSGGDPLSLGNSKLETLVTSLASIPHLQRLRIHTRFPVMIPHRVDAGLIALLQGTRLRTVVVLHINHAQEIDDALALACERLSQAGCLLLNQAVLLRRVNDTLDAQCELSLRLIDVGVVPYYLHHLDRVQGAAHFECSEAQGIALVEGMRARLPGYAVPRFVHERAGEASKSLIR